ncbi:30S ribosomal protein S2, partial [Patescibacteria group bacterium]|nr:30S ribosomal protein S2 [Patescibacteria group bacterium]
MTVKVSLKELIQAGAHFGHQSKRWNPKMAEYLHGVKDDVHVFDLVQTKTLLEEALSVLTKTSKEGKKILFLGTKKQAKKKIEEAAKACGSYFVNERWLGGTLTNFDQIKKSVNKLTEMKSKTAKGEYKEFTKKERLLIEREITRLERFFGGISEIETTPDLLIIIDIKRERSAVKEAQMNGIPVVAIVDSNCDPAGIDYPIPMNDDATRAISYVLDLMSEAILEGKGSKSIKSTKGIKG